MKIIEYRIFMPLTVEENLIGQLWSFAEVSKNNTGGGEGVRIAKNERFEVAYDSNGRVIYNKLPNYESYETQIASGSTSTPSSSSNSTNTSLSASKSLKNVFKKSSSKENFGKHIKEASNSKSERRKSLESIISASSVDFNISGSSTAHNIAIVNSNATNSQISSVDSEQTEANSVVNDTVASLSVHGQFTHKLYFIASKLPWYVRKFISKESQTIHEKSWNMYPQIKTVITNDFFRTNARIELDTITKACPNGKAEENVHNLTQEQLDKREIVVIDIADQVSSAEYKEEEDPTLFKSIKTGRGPLVKGEWISSNQKQPLICCYKLVAVEFKVFGLQTRAESYIKTMYKQLFTTFHRQIFCWIDKWHGLGLTDVRKIEDDLAKALLKKIDEGELSNVKMPDS